MAVQVNKAIDHMRYVDSKHVMWWASHAEGCDTIIDSNTGAPYCSKCDQSNAECAKERFDRMTQNNVRSLGIDQCTDNKKLHWNLIKEYSQS